MKAGVYSIFAIVVVSCFAAIPLLAGAPETPVVDSAGDDAPLLLGTICIATGPDDTVDGYLEICPDDYGSWAATSYGGGGDLFNPSGPEPAMPMAFTNGFFIFDAAGTERELLSDSADWQGIFPADGSLDRNVSVPLIAQDVDPVDGVPDTLTSGVQVFGGSLNMPITVEQHVKQILPGLSKLEQTYSIQNGNSDTASFVLVRSADFDLTFNGTTFGDDSVGTTWNTAGGDPYVVQREAGDPATSVRLTSSSATVYYGGKNGFDPDGGGVPFDFGTDLEVWDAYGVPDGSGGADGSDWRNHIAAVGYNTDGFSGASPAGCEEPCDGFMGLQIPLTLESLEIVEVKIVHWFGPPCGNDALDPGEECDGSADAACPGACLADCTCEVVTQACCFADLPCDDLTPADCVAQGGGNQGAGTSCAAGDCDGSSCPPDPTGDCCVDTNTVGCDDPDCCSCVCDFDPFCCDNEWDGICATEACEDCPAVCECCGPVDVIINELRIDQPETDLDEYFELAGPPGTSLNGLTYISIGDGTGGSGVIEAVVDLSGSSIGPGGFFVAAEGTFTLGVADLTTTLAFENSDNVTHLLVSGFTGSSGMDLDVGDDGVLDSPPWETMVDCIALVETFDIPGSGEHIYCATTLGRDGPFVPGHAYRCDPPGDWTIGAFPPGITDTPGAVNAGCAGACCLEVDCENMAEEECIALAGEFLGVGSDCGDCSGCGDCPTDVDGDGQTGASDLAALLGAWGPCDPEAPCACLDANEDGAIGAADLAALLGVWGPCP